MTGMKKLVIMTLALLALCTETFASKAVTLPMRVVLQDGRETTIALYGDENFSFWATAQGELIMRDGLQWRTATLHERNAAEQSLRKAPMTNEGIHASRPFPHMGNPKALVILAAFTDQSFFFSKDDIDNLFNSSTYDSSAGRHNYGSIAQYLDDMSDGQFRPQFDLVGPYTLPGTVADYGYNAGGTDPNIYQFIADACKAADNDVDFTQYDANGDGYADLVYVVYAGYGENWGGSSDYLWPKSGYGNYGIYDDVKVCRYSIGPELNGTKQMKDEQGNPYIDGIGVLVHELLHSMGLPDVYPTVTWSDITKYDDQSMEYWDVMDAGENTFNGYAPTPLTAFERELFGWMTIDTLDKATDVTLRPLQDGGKAYRVMNDNDATGNEYYILEAVPQGEGTGWYAKMPGVGMTVTHINYSDWYFSNFNYPNNDAGSPRWTLLPADGVMLTSFRVTKASEESGLHITNEEYKANMAADTYPGTQGVTEITDYKAYTGSVNKPITDIALNGFDVTFKFMGGTTDIATPQTETHGVGTAVRNIAGQVVNDSYRGIVISEGKKRLQKGR